MLSKVYMVYNTLFNHIEDHQRHLENKLRPWKKQLYKGLAAAHAKLSHYYSKTYDFHGVIYAIGTVLDPCQKLSVFQGSSWQDGEDTDVPWVIKYENILKKVYTYYRGRYPAAEEATQPSTKLNPIDEALHVSKRRRYNQQFESSNNQSHYHQYAELKKYLEDER